MTPARAIVLQSPVPNSYLIEALVDQCLEEDIALIAISGRNASALEAELDWLIIGDGTTLDRPICTSAHLGGDDQNAIGDALCLASSFSGSNGLVDRVIVIGQTFVRYRAVA